MARSDDVDRVVAHYRTFHPRAHPGEKERRLISARFKDGYSVEDLKQAINGCHANAHNRGENDRGRPYLELELIVRSSSNVAKFIEVLTTVAAPTPGIDVDGVKASMRRFGPEATREALGGEQNGRLTDGTP